jgi:hypothetical protein
MNEKKIAIMQPYFFPYIGYFQLIAAVDKFIVYDDVNFINRGWINRNNILNNGKSSLISVPLVGASQNKRIKDIELLYNDKWRISVLKNIELNYKKAPYFKIGYDLLQSVINTNSPNISEFNFNGIKCVCDYLNLTTSIVPSSGKYQNSDLKSQIRILDICQKESATSYYNPIGGINLYEKDNFTNNSIDLKFIKTKDVNYKQFKHEFIPNLSILDVLMFNSINEIKELLTRFEIINA